MTGIPEFLDELASGRPVPGGGSVAALEVAMAAALLAMVANLTIGRRKYADVQSRAEAVLQRALVLRDRARTLVDEDSAAYGRVAEAMALPRASDEDKAARQQNLQSALKGAALPPLETMSVAHEVMRLADDLQQFGNRSAASDVGSAALSAFAGSRAAQLNVEINLAGIRDDDWVASIRGRMEAVEIPASLVTSIVNRVGAGIGGSAG